MLTTCNIAGNSLAASLAATKNRAETFEPARDESSEYKVPAGLAPTRAVPSRAEGSTDLLFLDGARHKVLNAWYLRRLGKDGAGEMSKPRPSPICGGCTVVHVRAVDAWLLLHRSDVTRR
jgi:hypothetical protein